MDDENDENQPRSAHATIKGYRYQFDRTVLGILALGPEEHLVIEGVEDIDIFSEESTSAIQVKYLAAQKYTSPKSVRDPIGLMLNNFVDGKKWDYVLHVFFGDQPECLAPFSLDDLKNCLTKHNQKRNVDDLLYEGIDDVILMDFLQHLEIRLADDFDNQEQTVISTLKSEMNCSVDDAEILYHALAIDFVHNRAIQKEVSQRRVSKTQLLNTLAVRDSLYAAWHEEIVGMDRYRSEMIRRLRATGLSNARHYRGVTLKIDYATMDYAVDIAKTLSHDFIGKRRLTTVRPWTLVLDSDSDVLTRIKINLIRQGINFNDGREDIEFSASMFGAGPVLNTVSRSSIISRSSYSLRLVSVASLSSWIESGEQLTHLLVIGVTQPWQNDAARNRPVVISSLPYEDINLILEKIT